MRKAVPVAVGANRFVAVHGHDAPTGTTSMVLAAVLKAYSVTAEPPAFGNDTSARRVPTGTSSSNLLKC